MKTAFLITGLPRSRTAWLSNLFTFGRVSCLHDETGRLDSVEEVVESMINTGSEVVGLSDCGILPYHSEFVASLKARGYMTRTMMVRRDARAVVNGLCQSAQLSKNQVASSIAYLEGLIRPLLKSVDIEVHFHELDRMEMLEIAWYELTGHGEVAFPKRHAEKMLRMKVEVLPEIMYKSARQTPSGLAQRLANELSGILAR